jgi:hypothetical protein
MLEQYHAKAEKAVSTMMVASWQDKYEIAGTTQPFVAGQPVML